MESKESILNRWFLYKDPKDLSLLEALGKVSEGKLLAKILQNVPKEQLLLICRTSKYIKSICDKYELIDRLYAGELHVHDSYTGKKNIFKTDQIIQISGAYDRFAFVTKTGELYTFGISAFGELGDGNLNLHKIIIPFQIKNIPSVKQVSCGPSHTGFITTDGDLYTFGNGKYGVLGDAIFGKHKVGIPFKVKNISKVKQINCSIGITAFISENDNLYAFGIFHEFILNPEKQIIYKNVKYISRNLTFITHDNNLYKTEVNLYEDQLYLVKKNIFSNVKQLYVSFEKDYSLFVLQNGDLYKFYNNILKKIENIHNNVKEINFDSDSKCAIVTENHDLYTFSIDDYNPVKVKNIPKVDYVSIGSQKIVFSTKSDFKFDINCQICGSVAKYHTDKHLFCGRECFNEFYSFDK